MRRLLAAALFAFAAIAGSGKLPAQVLPADTVYKNPYNQGSATLCYQFPNIPNPCPSARNYLATPFPVASGGFSNNAACCTTVAGAWENRNDSFVTQGQFQSNQLWMAYPNAASLASPSPYVQVYNYVTGTPAAAEPLATPNAAGQPFNGAITCNGAGHDAPSLFNLYDLFSAAPKGYVGTQYCGNAVASGGASASACPGSVSCSVVAIGYQTTGGVANVDIGANGSVHNLPAQTLTELSCGVSIFGNTQTPANLNAHLTYGGPTATTCGGQIRGGGSSTLENGGDGQWTLWPKFNASTGALTNVYADQSCDATNVSQYDVLTDLVGTNGCPAITKPTIIARDNEWAVIGFKNVATGGSGGFTINFPSNTTGGCPSSFAYSTGPSGSGNVVDIGALRTALLGSGEAACWNFTLVAAQSAGGLLANTTLCDNTTTNAACLAISYKTTGSVTLLNASISVTSFSGSWTSANTLVTDERPITAGKHKLFMYGMGDANRLGWHMNFYAAANAMTPLVDNGSSGIGPLPFLQTIYLFVSQGPNPVDHSTTYCDNAGTHCFTESPATASVDASTTHLRTVHGVASPCTTDSGNPSGCDVQTFNNIGLGAAASADWWQVLDCSNAASLGGVVNWIHSYDVTTQPITPGTNPGVSGGDFPVDRDPAGNAYTVLNVGDSVNTSSWSLQAIEIGGPGNVTTAGQSKTTCGWVDRGYSTSYNNYYTNAYIFASNYTAAGVAQTFDIYAITQGGGTFSGHAGLCSTHSAGLCITHYQSTTGINGTYTATDILPTGWTRGGSNAQGGLCNTANPDVIIIKHGPVLCVKASDGAQSGKPMFTDFLHP